MSYWNDELNAPQVIKCEHGEEKIPSVIYIDGDNILVGKPAVEQLGDISAMDDAERDEVLVRTIQSVKMKLLEDSSQIISIPGRTTTPEEVVCSMLSHFKSVAEEHGTHRELSSLTLTHPVQIKQKSKMALKNAAHKAGFLDVKLIEEPVSAAMGYAASGGTIGDNILVFDLGAGTLDLAFITRGSDGQFSIPVKPMGESHCGGDAFDQAIYDHWAQQVKSEHGHSFAPLGETDLSVIYECRRAKEKLSSMKKARFAKFIPEKNLHIKCELLREDFEKLIEAHVNTAVDLTNQMLRNIKSANYEVDTALFIGGSTRVPLIREKLTEILPIEPTKTMHADVAVAMGAVVNKVATILNEGNSFVNKQHQTNTDRVENLTELVKRKEYGKAFSIAKDLAKDEDATAQYLLGCFFDNGQGVIEDSIQAVYWFKRSAEQGNSDAQYQLGISYYSGKGVSLDKKKAAKWLNKSASQHNSDALFVLGNMYFYGNGVEENERQAYHLYRSASKHGNQNALIALGLCLFTGRGCSVNEKEALDYLKVDNQISLEEDYLAMWLRFILEQELKSLDYFHIIPSKTSNDEYSPSYKKGRNMRRHFSDKLGEILCVYDSTVFGAADQGLALGVKGIGCSWGWGGEHKVLIHWDSNCWADWLYSIKAENPDTGGPGWTIANFQTGAPMIFGGANEVKKSSKALTEAIRRIRKLTRQLKKVKIENVEVKVKKVIKVIEYRCVACGACIESCPLDCISVVERKAYISRKNCIDCGLCVSSCPVDAILYS